MRKRNVSHIADTVFWYVLYGLPIILALLSTIGIFSTFTFSEWNDMQNQYSFIDFDFAFLVSRYCEALGVPEGADYNIIFQTLSSLFSWYDGILPTFEHYSIFQVMTWFVGVYLIHLCVDFILFIPRFAHKWMKKATEDD